MDVNIGSLLNRNNRKYQRFKIILTAILLTRRVRYSGFNPQVTKVLFAVSCGHSNAPYTHVEA
jgi:hypothetical protein